MKTQHDAAWRHNSTHDNKLQNMNQNMTKVALPLGYYAQHKYSDKTSEWRRRRNKTTTEQKWTDVDRSWIDFFRWVDFLQMSWFSPVELISWHQLKWTAWQQQGSIDRQQQHTYNNLSSHTQLILMKTRRHDYCQWIIDFRCTNDCMLMTDRLRLTMGRGITHWIPYKPQTTIKYSRLSSTIQNLKTNTQTSNQSEKLKT